MHVGCVIFLVLVCCIIMNSSDSGLWCLISAAQYVEGNTRDPQQEQSRNNFHGYARSPNTISDGERFRDFDRESDERSGGDGRERRRNGGRDEHNRLEKDRRAQLKQNFSALKDKIPHLKDKKASNLAILKGAQKQILLLKGKEREHEQTLQGLAKAKVDLLAEFAKKKGKFEHDHGLSADVYLDELNGSDADDDQGSDVTLSATEGPDNEHDFDDIEEVTPAPSTPMPPPAAPQNPRGIPHPVIRQTPAISIRLPQSTADGAPTLPAPLPVTVPTQQTTVKKQLQDKLKSAGTKQIVQAPVASQAVQLVTRPAEVSPANSSRVAMVPKSVSPRGTILSQPVFTPSSTSAAATTLPSLPSGGPTITLPAQATRKVVQSLLPGTNGTPRTFIPTMINARTSTAGMVVAAPLQANAPFIPVSTAVPTIALPSPALGPGIKGMCPTGSYAGVPSVLVTATGNGPYVIPVHGPNVLVMASPQHQLHNSSISSNGRT